MKTFVIILLEFMVATGMAVLKEDAKNKFRKYNDECAVLSGMSQENLQKVYESGSADDPKFKEHAFCMQQKYGAINKNGEIQKDTFRMMLIETQEDKANAETIYSECSEVKGDSPIERSVALDVCVHREKMFK